MHVHTHVQMCAWPPMCCCLLFPPLSHAHACAHICTQEHTYLYSHWQMLNGDRFRDKETEILVANTPAKQRHTGDPDYVGQVEKTTKRACTTERFGSLTPLMSCFHTLRHQELIALSIGEPSPGGYLALHWS